MNTLENYLAASGDDKPAVFRKLSAELREMIVDGRSAEAAPIIARAFVPTCDFTTFQSLFKLYKRLDPAALPKLSYKLAILGGFTTTQLAQVIELALFSMGAKLELFEADYGVYRQEILDPGSDMYRFAPQAVFLATTYRDLVRRPSIACEAEQVAKTIDAELADWAKLWQTAHDRLGCMVIQNNFDRPVSRQLDNHELRHPASLWNYIEGLNRALLASAPPYVTVHDVDSLAALAGRRNWTDERFFYHAKLPCAPEFLVDYGYNLASLLAAQVGLAKKCLVLDLDNTLWGGVIGDDGLGGVRLGQGGAEGEAFLAFQHYAKSLKERGVILAVCSKNDEHIAREVFEKHTEMVLRMDDISCFMANWTDKAANLREIARRLNIGLNSLVFVDDNPAERGLVRQLAPEVAVPEIPEDPAGYIEAVERHRYFQTTSIGRDDFQRSQYYRANALREEAMSGSANVGDYLQSLAMVAKIGPVMQMSLERTAQLINKSNQFNLTTRRRSAADVLALLQDPTWVTRTVSLADRFGDNGLISVVIGHVAGDTLEIDTWLMSCRVLKRGVEAMVHNHFCRLARSMGLQRLQGAYIPTPKNDLVREHYPNLGFELVSQEADGSTLWRFPIDDNWKPHTVYIEEQELKGQQLHG